MSTAGFRGFVLCWSQTQINLNDSTSLVASVQRDYELTMAQCEQQMRMIEQQRQFLRNLSPTALHPFGEFPQE